MYLNIIFRKRSRSGTSELLRYGITEVKARITFTSVNWWLELVKLRWLYGSKSENAGYFGKLKARFSETREEFTEVKARMASTSVNWLHESVKSAKNLRK